MNEQNIIKFYNELNDKVEGDYKIILEPNRDLKENWIEYDKVKWELEKSIQQLVDELLKNKDLSFEEKILKVYEHICLNYIYDANVLYFFKKDTSDINNVKYIAVDWYGRIVDEKWKENRLKHNRRICYEFARFYAKAINLLREEDNNVEAFMVGDVDNLHYVVGLIGDEYSVILDLDDFNSIKDLTRLKLGLTAKGIKILRDEHQKFQEALNKFNENRLENLPEIEEVKNKYKGKDTIKFFKEVINILNTYNIDPQGFFEFMRTLIENEGIEIEKLWKEDIKANEKRYERCLAFDFGTKKYLLDSIDKTLTELENQKLNKEIFVLDSEKKDYPYYGG